MSHALHYTNRMVSWTVTAYDRNGRAICATHPLEDPSTARSWRDYWAKKTHVSRIGITEHTTDHTERVIAFDELPAPGHPTPLPELPDGADQIHRHFRLTPAGPMVLRTGDDVRRKHQKIVEAQRNPTPTTVRVDPSALRLLEVTLTHAQRPVGVDELPDRP